MYLPKSPTGLDGPQKDQVGWRGYLNPKSGSPAIILGSPTLFSLPFCSVLVENFPRIQVVQRDYLNPTLGSPIGPFFLEFRSPGRWDSAICRALSYLKKSLARASGQLLMSMPYCGKLFTKQTHLFDQN